MTFDIAASRSHVTHKPRIDVRKCTDAKLREQFAQYIRHPPEVPWTTGVGQHAEALTTWLQKGVQQCFAADKSLPRQRYLSPATWSLIQLRKQLNTMSRQSSNMCCRLLQFWIFQAWKGYIMPDVVSRHETPVSVLQQMYSRCDQIKWWAIVQRRQLHPIARKSSRQDRIDTANKLAESFLTAAQTGDSKSVYRALKPLLGQQHRKSTLQFRPIPAVKMDDGTFAANMDQAQTRWQTHFAVPENGISVSPEQLQGLASLQAPRYAEATLPFHLDAIPTVEEVIQFIQKAKKHKAPGIDGLPAEIYQLDPVVFAHIYIPLIMKCAIRCTEPLRWKGGSVCALPKTQHPSLEVEQFRSILLADFSSKLLHGVLRQKLLPSFDSYRLVMQAGGVPGLGTDALNLFVQSFTRLCADQGASCTLLFVDVKQAFYRACRPFLVGRTSMPESAIVNLFCNCGWSPELYQAFRSHIFESSALHAAHVPMHLEAQVNSILSGTWFQLRDLPHTLTSTNTGTRPGDSLADILYGFLMGRFLKELQQRFQGHQLLKPLNLKWHPCPEIAPEELTESTVFQACWVDDLVLLLDDLNCAELVHKTQQAIALVQDCAAEFGLTLNYGRNKTSAVFKLRGSQAQKMWTKMLTPDPNHPCLEFDCISLATPGQLTIVPDYVYLGALVDGSGNPACEVKRRLLSLHAPRRLLSRGVFKSPRLPQRTRTMLFQALIMSKLVFSSGAWQQMHIHTQRTWHSQVMRLYAAIAPSVVRAEGVSTLDLLADVKLASPRLVLACQRVRLFSRIMQGEMIDLFAVLQAQDVETSWLTLVCRDLVQMSRLLPLPELDEALVQEDAKTIANFCFTHPSFLQKVTKKVVQSFQQYLQLWKDFRHFQKAYDDEASAFGVTWHDTITPRSLVDSYGCDYSTASFPTFHGLCTHVWKQHNIVAVAQKYAIGNTCRACLKRYDGRPQLLHHLKYFRTGCLLKLISQCPPLSESELQEIQEAERANHHALTRAQRKDRHRCPVMRLPGPQRPWPWQRSVHFVRLDRRSIPVTITTEIQTWISEILQAVPQSDPLLLYELLQRFPCHGMFMHLITEQFVALYQPEDSLTSMDWYLKLQEALTLWQEAHLLPSKNPCCPIPWQTCHISLMQVRVPPVAEPDQVPSMPERRKTFAEEHWEATDVPSQLHLQLCKHAQRTYIFPSPTVPPSLNEPIFLYVFSGRRRQGDYQSHVMQKLHQRGLPGRVLLLDLALSPTHDVAQPHLVPMLLSWFTQGAIAGLLVAPPCETWTEVRWEQQDGANMPRPLRTAEHPFCLPALKYPELQQLEVSNYLLYVAIRLFLAAVFTSTPAILEHPRQPKSEERASIWALPWLQQLLASPHASRELIWQAQFGAPSPKPTHLGVCHLPSFRRIMKQHWLPTNWAALRTLKGRDETGAWATTAAKEYPDRLNEAIAELHVNALHCRLASMPSGPQPNASIDSQFRSLYVGDHAYDDQVINPDYHGPRQFQDRANQHFL